MSPKILNIIVWRQQVLIKAFTVLVSGKSIRFTYHHRYRRARQTFPQDLIEAEFNELRELGTQYRQEFHQLNIKWEHRFSVKWHGEWINGLRLVSPPVESSNSQVRCQAWRFESLANQKYYAWAKEFWRENLPSAVVTLHAGQKTSY